MLSDFSRQGVAVNVNQFRCLALIPGSPHQRRLEESLFKFFQCFVEPDSAVQHFLNESFESVLHDATAKQTVKNNCLRSVTFFKAVLQPRLTLLTGRCPLRTLPDFDRTITTLENLALREP